MRILALCERAGVAGGVESYVRTLQEAFSGRGIEQRIVTRSDLQWSDEHDGGSAQAAAQLRLLCADYRPDVIALHNVLDALMIRAARECAANVTYHLHDHRLFCPNGNRVYPQGGKRCKLRMGAACAMHSLVHGCAYGPRPNTLQLIRLRTATAQAAMHSDAMIVFSQFMSAVAQRNGVPGNLLHLMRPPLHAAFFADRKDPDFTKPRVLFSGRAEPTKGLHSLVRAVATIEPERRPVIAVAGDGPDLDACVRLARSCDCRIELHGKLDRAGVITALDRSLIVAMPSLWDEPFGLTGIEAFARARPVVAYRSGAIGEWIGEGGRVVAPGDERALACEIMRLLDPREWRRAAAAAAARAPMYGSEQHVDALLRVYALNQQKNTGLPSESLSL